MKTIFFISIVLLVCLGSAERLLAGNSGMMSYNSLCKNWDKDRLTCMQCYEGCTKWENICVRIVKHCAKWDQEGNCVECEMGHGDMDSMPINETCPMNS